MCGIVGLVHREGQRPVAESLIRQMCELIRARGPDDEGRWVGDGVGLGMRRLSIIDLAGGAQPIWSPDRSKLIVFNGEIYNYRALRDGLIARGRSFRTESDTETVLQLYDERGPSCVEDLRGMFAFAIWDRAEQSLFLARDRFGIKPLYLLHAPWGIAFASELKALVATGLSRRELDWEGLDCFLQLGYIPAPASPFLDVRKLEPGCSLVWRRDGGAAPRRYWDHPRERRPAPPDAPARVREWIDDSVKAHLVADVPVAAFLSGGYDSSAVVASMAGFQQAPHAFTVRYAGSGAEAADETDLARQLADRCGARLTVVDVQPDVTRILEPIVWALDEPHADDSAIPTWLLSEAVAREYKVALTGIGGDELFGGYRRHLGLLLGQRYARLPAFLRRGLAAAASHLREPANAGLGVNRLKRFLAGSSLDPPALFLEYVQRIGDAERAGLYAAGTAELASNPARDRFEAIYREGGSPTGLAAALYLDTRTFLADDILALSDRLSMAHSLEVRVPLVDHALVEEVYPLPERLLVGRFEAKRLLKQALRPRLPEAHFRAPKRGFVGPTSAWLRNELRDTLHDELSPERMTRLGYFEPEAVSRLLREHETRRHNREGVLWALLCFSVWHRLYLEGLSPKSYPEA